MRVLGQLCSSQHIVEGYVKRSTDSNEVIIVPYAVRLKRFFLHGLVNSHFVSESSGSSACDASVQSTTGRVRTRLVGLLVR